MQSRYHKRVPLIPEDARRLYDEYMTDKEIAVTIGCSVSAVVGWRSRNGLPTVTQRKRQESKVKDMTNLERCVHEATVRGLSYGDYMNKRSKGEIA